MTQQQLQRFLKRPVYFSLPDSSFQGWRRFFWHAIHRLLSFYSTRKHHWALLNITQANKAKGTYSSSYQRHDRLEERPKFLLPHFHTQITIMPCSISKCVCVWLGGVRLHNWSVSWQNYKDLSMFSIVVFLLPAQSELEFCFCKSTGLK